MVHIEPDHFDLVLLGTGLEESILAAAAARAGKSVLHLDQSSHYGSAWSSFSLDQFLNWAHQQKTTSGVNELYSNVEMHQQQADLSSSRQYNMDLAAKAIFCSSETIDTLLAFGVQNYLDFKLFQGSYLYIDGAYAAVPTSRSAVFKDRSLSPADKRLLTRFLMRLVGAADKAPFPQADPAKPLVSLLKSEGLSPKLRQFLLYAVAMAEKDQEVLEQQSSHSPSLHSALSGSSSSAQFGRPSQHGPAQRNAAQRDTEATAESDTLGAVSSSGNASTHPADSAQHGNSNTHMGSAPSQNSTPSQRSNFTNQQPVSAQPGHDTPVVHTPGDKHDTISGASAQQSVSNSGRQHQQSMQSQTVHDSAVATAVEGLLSTEAGLAGMRQYLGSVGRYGPNTGALLTPMYGCGELPQAFCRVAAVNGALYVLRHPVNKLLMTADQQQCHGIETCTGQVIKCSAFAASSHLLGNLIDRPVREANGTKSSSEPSQHSQERQNEAPQVAQHIAQPHTATQRVSRAVCILDGSLQEGESQLLVVIPPQSLPTRNPNAIRVLQLGPAAAVCPSNRTLLHLSTPSTGLTAAEDLSEAVSALTNISGLSLQPVGENFGFNSSSNQLTKQTAKDKRPATLAVVFFNQVCDQDEDWCQQLPDNVVACSPPDVTIDPDLAVRHAKAGFAKLYPNNTSVFGSSESRSPDADSDDEALDALSGVLQNLDAA